MSAADREKWEQRYTSPDLDAPGAVDDFVSEVADRLPSPGAALDVAGGTGRHALWLAQRAFDVTLVDIAPTALSIARDHARARGLEVRTLALDLDSDPAPPGPFELIICTFYMPSDAQWTALAHRLAPGGALVMVLPTETNLARHARPGRRFLLSPSAIPQLIFRLGLSVVRSEIGWERRGRHLYRALATKRP